jgi:hypothetical protein
MEVGNWGLVQKRVDFLVPKCFGWEAGGWKSVGLCGKLLQTKAGKKSTESPGFADQT